MIFQITFPDRKEYAQAKNLRALQNGYKDEIGDEFLKVKSVTIIEEEVAKTIMLKSNEPSLCKEFSLFDTVSGDDFCIVGSTEW